MLNENRSTNAEKFRIVDCVIDWGGETQSKHKKVLNFTTAVLNDEIQQSQQ